MQLKNEKVLVTGAAGLIGSSLTERLLEEGALVRATQHRRPPAVIDPRVEYVQCDLTRGEDCRRVVQDRRYVFHCAAYSGGAAALGGLAAMAPVTPTILIDAQMFESRLPGRHREIPLVEQRDGLSPSEHPVTEDQLLEGDPYEKYYFYGWMKRFTEILCRMYGEKLPKPMTTIVLRPTHVYGIHDDFDLATCRVIPALIRKVVERWDPLEVWGTGNDVRDPIFVEDLVDLMLIALEKAESLTVVNAGLGKGYSVKEILQTVLEIDGYADARIVFNPSKPTAIPIRLVDVSEAERLLGFRAKTGLREGLRKTIDWYRAKREAAQDMTPPRLDPWQVVESRPTFVARPWIDLSCQQVRLPDGRLVDDYYQIKLIDYAAVFARTVDGLVVLERQYKHGIRKVSLTLPGGAINEGEDPLAAARRELLEETGYVADDWRSLGAYVASANYGCGKAHVFSGPKCATGRVAGFGRFGGNGDRPGQHRRTCAAVRSGEVAALGAIAAIALALNTNLH